MYSYDEVISRIVELRTDEDENRFTLGALCAIALEDMGVTAVKLSAEVGCSSAFIRQLKKTFEAFPHEEDRVAELSFQHHKLCAYTSDPKYWIRIASERELSTRELAKLIKGEAVIDELREADRIFSKVQGCIEAGGKGAVHLFDQLDRYLAEVNHVELRATVTEGSPQEEEESEVALHA